MYPEAGRSSNVEAVEFDTGCTFRSCDAAMVGFKLRFPYEVGTVGLFLVLFGRYRAVTGPAEWSAS